MAKFIALLRAVNVGGTGKLPMVELRAICTDAGFEQVQTYIASGNVIFQTRLRESKIKTELERRLLKHAGKPISVLIRSEQEIKNILAVNPFSDKPPNQTLVTFLDQSPPANAVDLITGASKEEIELGSREIYIYYPDGVGQSKLKIPAAKTGTARNLNTVRKLADLVAEL